MGAVCPLQQGRVRNCGAGTGLGCNLNIPLPAGSGHTTYLHAIDTIVVPALRRYRPDMIIVASGLDANAVDPLARQLLHSDSFRAMTTRMVDLADDLYGGRLAVIHEGGYAEAYVPFCGLAILEALAGKRSAVIDPELDFFMAQQPDQRVTDFQASLVQEMRDILQLD
nr:hypothetical protein [Novosphingobium sp. FSW06-99]